MANFEQILKSIDDNTTREVNLFNFEFDKVMKTIEEIVATRAIELYSDPLQFDFAMQQILQDSGYYKMVDEFINISYDKNYNEIIAIFETGGLAATFSQADISKIQAIKQLDLDFFRQVGNKAALNLKSDLYKYSLSNLDPIEMVKNIRISLQDTELARYSKTYAETSISNFNQSIIDLKSADVTDEAYVYRGVVDSKTREFCKCLISQNKYYTKADASKIKNDVRRKYNCRHLTIPVSIEYAEENYIQGIFTC